MVGASITDITFRGKNNSKNINLSLANTPVNSARIIEEDYDKKFIFNVRVLNNLDYFGRLDEIAYLDENIIIFNSLAFGAKDRHYRSHTYSINTGKQIEMKDFISNLNDRNLLALLRKKVLEYAANSDDDSYDYSYETYYSFDNDLYSFYITPKGITFYTDYYYRYYYEESSSATRQFSLYIDFTFEELKPFIKRGSPLDYLFN